MDALLHYGSDQKKEEKKNLTALYLSAVASSRGLLFEHLRPFHKIFWVKVLTEWEKGK